MNTELLKSKKFRSAVIAAVTALLTYGVGKWGWDLDVEALTLLMSVISAPFLIYIGAEGFSEAGAKKVIEENKVRAELTDKVLLEVAKQLKENEHEV